jgi:hypothetical protein
MAHFARILHEREYVFGRHYVPHDAEQEQQTDKEIAETRVEMLERLRVRPVEAVGRVLDKMDGINAARNILPVCWFDEAKCGERGIPALQAYQRKWDERLAVWRDTPLHNWASNGADAFMQFAQLRRMVPMARTKRPAAGANWRTV